MNTIVHEARLLWRSPVSVVALAVLLLLSSLAVVLGLREVAAQHATLARLAALQAQDLQAQARTRLSRQDAGTVAYYTFHGTWDAPSSAAFTTWEQRLAAASDRALHQSQVDQEFDTQPDRHPNRMVHYGHFVFRAPAAARPMRR